LRKSKDSSGKFKVFPDAAEMRGIPMPEQLRLAALLKWLRD
jgi:hypothetical protein